MRGSRGIGEPGSSTAAGVVPEQRIVGARIRNLAPIDRLDIAIDPDFNVLYGLNGVGKSRLLHALAMDPELTPGAGIELHLSNPPTPIHPESAERWTQETPGNPWGYLLSRGDSEQFPGVTLDGPVAHLMFPVYEAARVLLDSRSERLPRHAESVVFCMLEFAAQIPRHAERFADPHTLQFFVEAALQVALDGRFVVRLDDGYVTMDLAAARPAPHTPLGQLIAQHLERVMETFGARDGLGLFDSLSGHLKEHLEERGLSFDHDNEVDPNLAIGAMRNLLQTRWDAEALESCFHPLLAAGRPLALETAGVHQLPAWYAEPVLQVYVPQRLNERLGVSILADWRTRDLEEIQRRTFALLPPLLLRIGDSTAPEYDFGITTSSEDRAVFETNTEQQAVVRDIEGFANAIYRQVMDDAPRLEIVQRSPAGDARFFMWGLLDWVAVEQSGQRVHVSALSDALKRWAQFAISLALELRGGVEKHARLVVIDEPERGLHRLAERRLAEGLAQLGEDLGLTFVVATHSPAFLRLQHAQRLHLRRDEHGSLGAERFDGRLDDPALLGLSPADRAHFLEAVVLVADELDVAAFEGFLGASMTDHGIAVRVLPDVTEASGSNVIDQIARLTDAHILIVADDRQLPVDMQGFDTYHELQEHLEAAGELSDDDFAGLGWAYANDPSRDSISSLAGAGPLGGTHPQEDRKWTPRGRFRRRVELLTEQLEVRGGAARIRRLAFDRREFLDALALTPRIAETDPETSYLLAQAWSSYYEDLTDEDPSIAMSELLDASLGIPTDAHGILQAASGSDRVPEIVNRVLDAAAGRWVPDSPPQNAAQWTPPEDVPF